MNIKHLIAITACCASLNSLAHEQCGPVLTIKKLYGLIHHNHPAVRSATLEYDAAKGQLLRSRGAFDLGLAVQSKMRRFNSSSDIGVEQNSVATEATLSMLTRYGAELSLGYDLSRGDIKTPISPTGEKGEAYAQVKMPFLRGAGFNKQSYQELVALFGLNQARNSYREQELSFFLKGADSYWKWIAAIKQRQIRRSLIDLAQFRLKAVRSMSHSGDLASIDIVEAQQELARRQGRLAQAERYLQEMSYELAWYIWDDSAKNTHYPEVCQAPHLSKRYKKLSLVDLKQGKLDAIKNRPELGDIALSRSIAKLDRDMAKNQLLPKIDLWVKAGEESGRNSISGVAGEAGVAFQLPIQRREAKGALLQAETDLRDMDLKERSLVQRVFLQVADARSAINNFSDQIRIAQNELRFAKKLERGERAKFKHGDSTLFILNRRERATAEAQIKLILLEQRYHQAEAYFAATTGTLKA